MTTAPVPDPTALELPSPPFVPVEGIYNFRDAGGYAVTDSLQASVRRGFLYRCADPSRVTDKGQQAMRDAGIKTIFDMRSKPEIDKAAVGPVAAIAGIDRVETPAFKEQDYSPEAIAERYRDYATGGVDGFTRAYADILRNAGPSLRTILLHVRDRPAAPLLVHCSAGKDRTGIAVMLLLALAGADDETIAREYALTEQGLGPLRDVMVRRLVQSPSLNGDRASAERMTASKTSAEYMTAALAIVRSTYGGVDEYVKKECGLSVEDVELVRKNMRADVAPVL